MVALKGIPKVLSPELLFALARMGHGDEIGELLASRQHGPLAGERSARGILNRQGPAKAWDTAIVTLPFRTGSHSAASGKS